jgi:ankyrin repeat protein
MSRLYLYTTLPITKIVDLIYADSSNVAPGCVRPLPRPSPIMSSPHLTCRSKDSANKKLNAMLDKEPRWLHPKNELDMDRRVAELSNSPTRSPCTPQAGFSRPHSFSDPMPYLASAPCFNVETATRPSTRNASPAAEWSVQHAPVSLANTPTFGGSMHTSRGSTSSPNEGLGLEHNNDLFGVFLRQTTFMSSSTSRTTGSFHRVLHGYSEPYIKTVRRLVKRFTLPNNNHANRQSVSPISERPEHGQTSWIDDDDAPSVFRERPYPLPGDFLHLDTFLQEPYNPVTHESPDSPWITSIGLTQNAHKILSIGIEPADVGARDAYGNTVLHFLTVRGTVELLLHALETGFCDSIINAQNSAGQTFFHLATANWLATPNRLNQLMQALSHHNFNFYARDHYGRNMFHVFRQEDIDPSPILLLLDRNHYAKRDAFNIIPLPHPGAVDAMNLDPSAHQRVFEQSPEFNSFDGMMPEAKLLRYVRLCQENPSLEDELGRNGLHCLAMVTLSMKNAESRAGSVLPVVVPDNQTPRRKSTGHNDDLDSSETLLQMRYRYVSNLLDSGVDPNHYDHQGNTPLMAFAAELPEDDDYKTGPKILELLLDRGANIHARNRAGETALHIAIRCGRKLAVRTICKRNANVHARDAAGRSLLDVADVKMKNLVDDDPRAYAHFEACRAWISGPGAAVQQPTALQEWGYVRSV